MTSRRSFLTSLGLVLVPTSVVGCSRTKSPQGGIAHLYSGLNSSDFFESEMEIEATVPDQEAFTEGPAVDPDGNVFFTNIPASRIYRWDSVHRELSVFREGSGQANGLLFEPSGGLLACEQELGRVTRTDIATGEVSILADRYQGEPLEPPNDLAIDKDLRVYFSSRPSSAAPTRGSVNAVYRVWPGGELERLLAEPDVQMPNGLDFSPDGRTLYLVEADPGAGRHRHIKAYSFGEDGTLGNPRVLFDFYPGRSGDGMCVDVEGNLYVAAGLHEQRGTSETLDTRPGIHVISSQGVLMAYLGTPVDTVTNCTFGGQDRRNLYVTCGPHLMTVRTRIAGSG